MRFNGFTKARVRSDGISLLTTSPPPPPCPARPAARYRAAPRAREDLGPEAGDGRPSVWPAGVPAWPRAAAARRVADSKVERRRAARVVASRDALAALAPGAGSSFIPLWCEKLHHFGGSPGITSEPASPGRPSLWVRQGCSLLPLLARCVPLTPSVPRTPMLSNARCCDRSWKCNENKKVTIPGLLGLINGGTDTQIGHGGLRSRTVIKETHSGFHVEKWLSWTKSAAARPCRKLLQYQRFKMETTSFKELWVLPRVLPSM
ncbi:uncharacterized protein LOC130679732 [Manis pentadactyla]|uniref:uncharacterized protein LOC130679732 n=1 Tax=Manis pentadactyla TaxID=143292 RepID=UPI00255D0FEE|nr:uncharacterized protein LOC130679732 [Manis pentadactyla]